MYFISIAEKGTNPEDVMGNLVWFHVENETDVKDCVDFALRFGLDVHVEQAYAMVKENG